MRSRDRLIIQTSQIIQMANYYMTEKEQQFLTVASIDQNQWHEWVGIDPAYVYFDFNDLLEANIPMKQAEGLLSSLLQKGIVEVEMAYADMNVFDKGEFLYSFTEEFCTWVAQGGNYKVKN